MNAPTVSRPRVSVVVASYNHAPFVRQSLLSVLQQDFQDVEILVTDDGSRDGTPEQVQAVKDPRILLKVLPENRGACIAMNDGIRRARGEYIAVLNSDDVFLPGKLAKQLAFLEAHPHIAAVFGYPVFIDERGERFDDATHKDHAVFHVHNRTRHEWLRHFFDLGNALCHPTVMIRRRAYETVGLYDARLAQVPDLDMWMRVCLNFDIHVQPEPVTGFRIRDNLLNASAARPEVVIRDAWERAHILRHYLGLSRPQLDAVFPEYAGRSETVAELLAERALSLSYPFYVRFALDTLFQSLPPDGEGPAYRRLIALTGQQDLHRLYPR